MLDKISLIAGLSEFFNWNVKKAHILFCEEN